MVKRYVGTEKGRASVSTKARAAQPGILTWQLEPAWGHNISRPSLSTAVRFIARSTPLRQSLTASQRTRQLPKMLGIVKH